MNDKLKTDRKFSFETIADIAHIGKIIDFAETALDKLGVTDNARGHICLAVDEIVTNVAMYAYKETKGKITVAFERLGNKVIVTITDSGAPFNPAHHPTPDTSAGIDQRQIGGLGIHLVRKMTDKMEYRRIGNENRLVLKKNIGGTK